MVAFFKIDSGDDWRGDALSNWYADVIPFDRDPQIIYQDHEDVISIGAKCKAAKDRKRIKQGELEAKEDCVEQELYTILQKR